MSEFFFDVPWWALALIGTIGIALFVSGNRRQQSGRRTAGLAVIGVAILWGVVSYLVDTPIEICQNQTRQFVAAVVGRDWGTFTRLTAPQADFKFVGSSWEIDGRDKLVDSMKADIDQIGLKGAHITSMQPVQKPNAVVIRMRVYSIQDISLGEPLDSEWELEWRPAGKQWQLAEIRGIRVANIPSDYIRGSLRRK